MREGDGERQDGESGDGGWRKVGWRMEIEWRDGERQGGMESGSL